MDTTRTTRELDVKAKTILVSESHLQAKYIKIKFGVKAKAKTLTAFVSADTVSDNKSTKVCLSFSVNYCLFSFRKKEHVHNYAKGNLKRIFQTYFRFVAA